MAYYTTSFGSWNFDLIFLVDSDTCISIYFFHVISIVCNIILFDLHLQNVAEYFHHNGSMPHPASCSNTLTIYSIPKILNGVIINLVSE